MNSAKSANLLMVAYNYKSQGKKVLLVKPVIDTRFGSTMIASRAINGVDADLIIDGKYTNFTEYTDYNCILCDEAQFLSIQNIDGLREISRFVPVICYGLRTDYTGHLFEGSKRLFEMADVIEEIKTVCVKCDKKATINAKFRLSTNNSKIILYQPPTNGQVIELGGEDLYQPMCYQCWKN